MADTIPEQPLPPELLMPTLDEQISQYAAAISTTSYSMSVGELIAMYRDGEIDLHPEFQRFFRWTPEQKSRFIESLLLNIPIPPVFVAEREDSKWDVIDGLQRLSTVLEVAGELKLENGTLYEPFKLSRTRYLTQMEGLTWRSDNPHNELSEAARIRIKRARIDMNIVKNTSGALAKYEIFQRLNTGGSNATDQEVRNCLLLMTNRSYFEWVRALAAREEFRTCIPLSDRALEEAYDLELVVRFLVLLHCSNDELGTIDELGSFLTDRILGFAGDASFDRAASEQAFTTTFAYLATHLGENAFRKYDDARNKYTGAMLISLFEVVAPALGNRVLAGTALPDDAAFCTDHKALWRSPNLIGYVGSGIRASTRIPKTVAAGRVWLTP